MLFRSNQHPSYKIKYNICIGGQSNFSVDVIPINPGSLFIAPPTPASVSAIDNNERILQLEQKVSVLESYIQQIQAIIDISGPEVTLNKPLKIV